MTTRIWTNKQTVDTVNALKNAGYDITRDSVGYKAKDIAPDFDGPVFAAMQHTKDEYLIRYHPKLFGEPED